MTTFRIDLHVHTSRYSQCAEFLEPYRIEEYAHKAGLSGIVLTEHDIFWQDEEIEMLQEALGKLHIFRGIEVSAQDCHLVVIGIDDAAEMYRGASTQNIVEVAHRSNAAVILAHPYRDSCPDRVPVELVTAIEVASTSFSADEAKRAIQLAKRFNKPMVASSDAHALSRIGWAWTEFPTMPSNEAELAQLLHAGKGLPRTPNTFP